jgi:hypothetical protein
MKLLYLALAVLALGVVPAAAQSSFAESCRYIQHHSYGDRLTADCLTVDGRWVSTELDAVSQCVGDIGNQDGRLVCNRPGERFRRDWR